jgi:DNA methylase
LLCETTPRCLPVGANRCLRWFAAKEFIRFLNKIDRAVARHLDVHAICDNWAVVVVALPPEDTSPLYADHHAAGGLRYLGRALPGASARTDHSGRVAAAGVEPCRDELVDQAFGLAQYEKVRIAVGVGARHRIGAADRHRLTAPAAQLDDHRKASSFRIILLLDSGQIDHGSTASSLAMHPTVKPVALVADAIKDCSRRGEIVLDLFAGSGTTLIAAHTTGRRAQLVEFDPAYCDQIARRFEQVTGKQAILVATGQSFEVVAEARALRSVPQTSEEVLG